ncbi:MAG: fructosamine kinase family protein [Sciscionella sp.]
MSAAEAAVSELLGIATSSSSALSGSVYLVGTANGTVVAKRGAGVGAAPAEAAGLRWLAEPQAVPVPSVLGHNENWVVTELLDNAAPSPAAAEQLGRGLAELHAAGAPAFGSPPSGGPMDAWIGLAPMRNVPSPGWPEWYAEYRIQPYLRRALDSGALHTSEAAVIDNVCERIATLGVPPELPSRLHGDLWNGNLQWDGEQAWLIDPAAHGGHRETDLAMLRLFDCPYLDRILGAYREVAPLADGWAERVPLHQLYPLLVHTVLFGGGYARQAVAAARQALTLHSR